MVNVSANWLDAARRGKKSALWAHTPPTASMRVRRTARGRRVKHASSEDPPCGRRFPAHPAGWRGVIRRRHSPACGDRHRAVDPAELVVSLTLEPGRVVHNFRIRPQVVAPEFSKIDVARQAFVGDSLPVVWDAPSATSVTLQIEDGDEHAEHAGTSAGVFMLRPTRTGPILLRLVAQGPFATTVQTRTVQSGCSGAAHRDRAPGSMGQPGNRRHFPLARQRRARGIHRSSGAWRDLWRRVRWRDGRRYRADGRGISSDRDRLGWPPIYRTLLHHPPRDRQPRRTLNF